MSRIEWSPNGGAGDHTAALTPPTTRGSPNSHAHTVQFYRDDAFLLDELSRFIGPALAAGQAAVVAATPAHRDGLVERLTAQGFDPVLAAGQGRYVSLDAAETLMQFMVDGWPDAARFADLLGGVIAQASTRAAGERPRVAVFGELVALLCAEGKHQAAIRLEQLWNDLAERYSFDLHCAYPISSFSRGDDGEPFATICTAHSRVIPAESYTTLRDDDERLRTITLLQQKAQALETEIEERKKAQAALRERNRELRAAVAARDEFLSVAAHELKTPLTSLRAFAQLLLRDIRRQRAIAPERLESALDAIEQQTGKLNHLVTRLLDTAQVQAGKLRVEPVETDLAALVRSALAQHRRGASHTLVFAGPEQLEAVVDPVRFEQVVTNLLDNAVKYSPEGGTVTVALDQDNDGAIRLSVADQGVGVPPDRRERVFDRFHQAHGERHLSGMGLGLYITRQIVELHGGSVRIEEPEHPGARFVVVLPPSAGAARIGSAA